MSIAPEAVLSRNANILYAAVGTEEAVMLSIDAGRYFGLNAVAARVWELLDTPHTMAKLCEQICQEFDVEAAACEADLRKFLSDLVGNGIVHAVEAQA